MRRLQLRYSQKDLQASLPEIGIFWIIYDKERFPRLGFEIFGDTISIKEAKTEMPDRAILDTPAEHYKVWNSKKNEWGFPYDEYEEHPRGRVVYRRKNSTFYIICGPTKQMPWLSFFSALGSSASRAMRRTSGLVRSPMGKRAVESCSCESWHRK